MHGHEQPISPTASAPPTLGDMLDEIVPVLATVSLRGRPSFWPGREPSCSR